MHIPNKKAPLFIVWLIKIGNKIMEGYTHHMGEYPSILLVVDRTSYDVKKF
jgi:hypothetical protein